MMRKLKKSNVARRLKALKPTAKQEIWIFYSSEKEPGLPAAHAQGIDYLPDSKIKRHIIDINMNPGLAESKRFWQPLAMIIKNAWSPISLSGSKMA
jgi:hypothetical protein